ncbi:MAG: hypothetical protein ACOX0F_11195 [Syntrophomonadaceae bacterium]
MFKGASLSKHLFSTFQYVVEKHEIVLALLNWSFRSSVSQASMMGFTGSSLEGRPLLAFVLALKSDSSAYFFAVLKSCPVSSGILLRDCPL